MIPQYPKKLCCSGNSERTHSQKISKVSYPTGRKINRQNHTTGFLPFFPMFPISNPKISPSHCHSQRGAPGQPHRRPPPARPRGPDAAPRWGVGLGRSPSPGDGSAGSGRSRPPAPRPQSSWWIFGKWRSSAGNSYHGMVQVEVHYLNSWRYMKKDRIESNPFMISNPSPEAG